MVMKLGIAVAGLLFSMANSQENQCLELKDIYKKSQCCSNKENRVCPAQRKRFQCHRNPKSFELMFTPEELTTMRKIEGLTLKMSGGDGIYGYHMFAKRCGKFTGWNAHTGYLVHVLTGAKMVPVPDPQWNTAISHDPTIETQLLKPAGQHVDLAMGWQYEPSRVHSGVKALPDEAFEGFHNIPMAKMTIGTIPSKVAELQNIIDTYDGDKSEKYWEARALFNAGKVQVARAPGWIMDLLFAHMRPSDDSVFYPKGDNYTHGMYQALTTGKADFRIEKNTVPDPTLIEYFVQSDHVIPGKTIYVSPRTERQQDVVDALAVIASKGLFAGPLDTHWYWYSAEIMGNPYLYQFGAEDLPLDDPLWGTELTHATFDPLPELWSPEREFHAYNGVQNPMASTYTLSDPCWF